jgi:hypothetical protein
MPLFTKPTVPIYGFLGYLQFTANIQEGDEAFLYRVAQERHEQLESEIRRQVEKMLGSDVEVLRVRIEKGSVEILVWLGMAVTIFMTFSRYESFVKSVNLLVSQIKNLLRRFFESASPAAPGIDFTVTGSWEPSQTVLMAQERLSASSSLDYSPFLLAYLILSHAALLALMVWLVVKHLK